MTDYPAILTSPTTEALAGELWTAFAEGAECVKITGQLVAQLFPTGPWPAPVAGDRLRAWCEESGFQAREEDDDFLRDLWTIRPRVQ